MAAVGASPHRSRIGGEIVTQFEKRLRIRRQLCSADAVGKPVARSWLQVLGHARPLAQLNHDRVFDCKPAKAMPVGSAARRRARSIPAVVVLGAGDGEAIAEAVELFRVDRIDLEAALEQVLTIGPCGTSIATAFSAVLPPLVVARRRTSPPGLLHLAKALSPIIFAISCNKADFMVLARPVDAERKNRTSVS